MSTYSVVIGSTTINANGTYSMRITKNLTEAGKVDSVDVYIEVEGDVVDAPVIDNAKVLSDLVTAGHSPVTVQIKQDSTTKYQFTPAASFQGPLVILYETPEAEGNGDSRQRYHLTIYCKLPGNAFKSLRDLDTSILVVDKDGEIIRKVWKATATGLSLNAAVAAVKAFKPNGTNITGEIEKFPQQKKCTGMWVWEGYQNATSGGGEILWVEETIEALGGGVDYIEAPQPDDEDPVLHETRRKAWKVTVSGIIRGFSDKLEPPDPHFKENGKDIVRVRSAEPSGQEPTQVDLTRQLWGLRFYERYIITKAKLPKANHGTHKNSTLHLPPADGGIMGSA